MTQDTVAELTAAGVAVWLDDISRERLSTGNLQQLVSDLHVSGVTSNPTIFDQAISHGSAYDGQLADLGLRDVTVDAAAQAITTFDIRWGCDVLRPVYNATGGLDGRVSLEVDPRIAQDGDKTVAEARALSWQVDRPNLFIKIPATRPSLPAITAALSEGISINVTLIFSLQRYLEVIDAFMAGLEGAAAAGHDISGICSVASFFVSRVDTEVDRRLDALGTPAAKDIRGKAALANARLAYQLFEQRLDTDRWRALARLGARPQRPLWASTSTKDPAYRDTMYVEELVADQTVNTMPEATLHATADHGRLRGDTIHGTYDESAQVISELEKMGISYNDVVGVLEAEGVRKFADSWQQMLDTIGTQLKGSSSGQ